MKNKNKPKAEDTLAEKHQLKDVAWAIKQNRRLEEKNRFIRTLKLFFSRFRARMAVRLIRSQARRDGLDHMTSKDINRLIRKVREKRKN